MWPFSAPYPELSPADVGAALPQSNDAKKLNSFTYDYIIVGGERGRYRCSLL
jgi:hypothetical protein